MLTVAGGIILAIVLIAVFIGLLLFDVEWIPKEPNAGMPNDGVFWLPSADPRAARLEAMPGFALPYDLIPSKDQEFPAAPHYSTR